MNILTCNIRTSGAEDGTNNWVYRKDLCIEVIQSRSPDIICFQEMAANQFADIHSSLRDFEWHVMVDTPTGRNSCNAICYRNSAYNRISAGGYWLSETPHVAGSKSWDSACVRLANWVRLEERATGTEFRIVNTHLDHVGQLAREHQAQLIAEDSATYPDDYLQILTGDMNCDSKNKAIDVLRAASWVDTYGMVHETEDPGHTYHEFLGPQHVSATGKMDWIFVRGSASVVDAEVITDSKDGRFPSDHYFVKAAVTGLDPDCVGKPDASADADPLSSA